MEEEMQMLAIVGALQGFRVLEINDGSWIFANGPIAVRFRAPEGETELEAIRRALVGLGLVLPSDN